MEKLTTIHGVVAPLDRANVDTDAIIPKQFLKSIRRSGFGPNLFDDWRYLDTGEPDSDNSQRKLNPDFVLNKTRYANAKILLTRENFGCGSSREHAPWALKGYGFDVIIAPTFADIFFANCFKNALLPITLDSSVVESLMQDVVDNEGYHLLIDLPAQTITKPNDELIPFEVDAFQKHCLINGLDDIGVTLQHTDKIKAYEEKQRKVTPWLFRE